MKYIFIFGLTGLILACGPGDRTNTDSGIWNPAARGFNAEGSDPEAVRLADEVMQAMGGRKAWNQAECISWNFFGSRKLIWDKSSGMVKIDYLKQDMKAVVDIDSKKGKVWKDGKMIQNKDSLDKYLEQAYRAWINDSYWLLMPFKLKDTGVTLQYMGEDSTQAGEPADKIQMTFENVGVTPQNKYYVWVNKNNHLITQWAYFRDRTQDEPNFITPWNNYTQYGDILISGDRGNRKISDIAVYKQPPKNAFRL